LKIIKIILLTIYIITSALLFSCARIPTDQGQATSGEAVQTDAPSETETGIEPVTAPATDPATEPVTEHDPAAQTEEKIAKIIKSMTTSEKIGQLFMVRCNAATAVADVEKYNFGGYVMFAEDYENNTPKTAAAAVASYQAASKLPLLITTDEEGGTVVRVSKYTAYRSEPFKSPAALYSAGGLDSVLADIDEKSALLKSVGINCNLAPVCDVSVDPDNYIYPRTLERDAAVTAGYISASVTRYIKDGMGCVLKHFPGYGGNSDTHKGLSVDTRDISAFENGDLKPFIAGIKAGAGAIMVSHNIVECFDPDYPSSLSIKIHDYLRSTLGYDGVIMTDALDMGAILEFSASNNKSAAVLAIEAGNDMICISDYTQAYADVTAAVEAGTITEARINESVARILRWKISLGILQVNG
jgi:Beta-glucosidase-related glycosidases